MCPHLKEQIRWYTRWLAFQRALMKEARKRIRLNSRKWKLQDLSLSPVSGLGPEIVDSWGLNSPLLPLYLLEKVGGEDPHLFQ